MRRYETSKNHKLENILASYFQESRRVNQLDRLLLRLLLLWGQESKLDISGVPSQLTKKKLPRGKGRLVLLLRSKATKDVQDDTITMVEVELVQKEVFSSSTQVIAGKMKELRRPTMGNT
ncbi:hypothetical protein ACFE04_003643 [Oxalis oulophora]